MRMRRIERMLEQQQEHLQSIPTAFRSGLKKIDAEKARRSAEDAEASRARGGFDANSKKTFGGAPGEERSAAGASQPSAVLRALAF